MKKDKEESKFMAQGGKTKEKSKAYSTDDECDYRVRNSRPKTKFKKCNSFVK